MKVYVDELPKDCINCIFCEKYGYYLYCSKLCEKLEYFDKEKDCPLKLLTDRLAEERKMVCNQARVDIRSLFDAYASSIIDYCIWNKNADANQKLYNNFKRIVNDRLVKVLDLFDKRIDQIERGE